MKLLRATLESPAANLACDEALLDTCEETGEETLRFWESPTEFVVVGYGNSVSVEANEAACLANGVPILRRCSGGGTVVQGPGCLNYNLTLQAFEDGPLATVTGTNRFVMEQNRRAFEKLLGREVSVQGHTDLAISEIGDQRSGAGTREGGKVTSAEWTRFGDTTPHPQSLSPLRGEGGSRAHFEEIWKRSEAGTRLLKFSGNAQRRRRQSVLFHGTVLYRFDLSRIAQLLKAPSKQPDYRANRSHEEFVANIPAGVEAIIGALKEAWNANEILESPPLAQVERLVAERYGTVEWNAAR